ncbi:MAG: Fic family protein [Solirubrobacterales bacterium]
MKSFMDAPSAFDGMPADVGVLLGRIDVSKGREQLYEVQLPELLQALSEQSRVESIRASIAIEGIEVDDDRAERLARPDQPRPRNRSEKEFAGYRDAIDEMMRADRLEHPTVPYMLHLHRVIFQYTDARGGYLKTEDNLIATREGDHRRIDFKPPAWQETESLLRSMFDGYRAALANEQAHPLVLLSALVLDFLAIHPVLDGNGRTARLLTTHELVRLGYGVARYSSVEQRIWETKNRYYQALRDSQEGWLEGGHSIWPWGRYLAGVISDCYERFEQGVTATRDTSGMNKQERVQHWVRNLAGDEFRLQDVRRALPGVSDQTIRLALEPLKAQGLLRAESSGRGARWIRVPRSEGHG